ncbi:hypothetical protein D3C85_711450 [compost metagenome]
MPLGALVGGLFFIMLALAALTSTISLIEPTIAWLGEKFSMGRIKAVLLSGAAVWLLSLGSVLSFNAWSEVTLLGKTFFDGLDFLTSNLMMPLGGLFTVLFTGWVMKRALAAQAIGLEQNGGFGLWWLAIRWITPLAILLMFLHSLGLF